MQDVCQKIHYGFTASASKTGNSKLLRITDIQDGSVEWRTVPFCDVPPSKLPSYQLSDGDVVIARTGGTIGKSYLIKGVTDTAVFASYLIRLIFNEDLVDPKYTMAYLNSPEYWKQLKGLSQGTGQPNVNSKSLSSLKIPTPPLAEQRRIVAKLEESFTEIDRAEKAFRELQTLAGVLKKKILQEAVMGKLVPQLDGEPTVEQIGDAPEDVPFEIPEKWKWLTFNEVLSFENGDRGTNYPAKSTLTKDSSSGQPFISAVNLQNLHISNDNLLYLSKEQQRKLRSGHVKAGDCLFCIRGSLGKFAFADKDGGAIASSLVILRSKSCNCIMQKYLSYVLLSPYFTAYMNDRRNGTAQPNLGAKELKTFPIPIPPIEEQGRIVAKTEELMKQVERLVS